MLRFSTRLLCRRSITLTSPSCRRVVVDQKQPAKHGKSSNLSLSSSSSSDVDKNKSRVKQIQKYWIFRYIDYVKNYEKVMEKNFPKTMHVYRVFSIGTKDFYYDLKRYMQVRKKIRKLGVDSLTRDELQLTFTFPKDLIKISPVLLISAIPFTNYIIFPLAFYFPHKILTSHYWSIQDKLNFMMTEHKRRLKHYKPVLRCLQSQVVKTKDENLQMELKNIVAHLGSGTHPSPESILKCKPLFSGPPFSLEKLKRKHVKELLKIHGIRQFGFGKKNRLQERGLLIKRMDIAIEREGGVANLPYEAIRWALSFRGINPVNMSTESMQNWLKKWLLISTQIDNQSISLILHCPILLAYYEETNWTLLHYDKNKQ